MCPSRRCSSFEERCARLRSRPCAKRTCTGIWSALEGAQYRQQRTPAWSVSAAVSVRSATAPANCRPPLKRNSAFPMTTSSASGVLIPNNPEKTEPTKLVADAHILENELVFPRGDLDGKVESVRSGDCYWFSIKLRLPARKETLSHDKPSVTCGHRLYMYKTVLFVEDLERIMSIRRTAYTVGTVQERRCDKIIVGFNKRKERCPGSIPDGLRISDPGYRKRIVVHV